MTDLFAAANRCLAISDPDHKIDATRELVGRWHGGHLAWQEASSDFTVSPPGRPQRPLLVPPNQVERRGFGSLANRAALIHALAHIEHTAINLAWDTVVRYPGMPRQFYDDWITAAADESEHFLMLRERLRHMGFEYGDFVAHQELWNNAERSSGELAERMAIVHRVLEARALDVVPRIRRKFLSQGDRETARALERIANDEVAHVGAGSRWFHYRCDELRLEPEATFFGMVKEHFGKYPTGPFNRTARLQAGFSESELARLANGTGE